MTNEFIGEGKGGHQNRSKGTREEDTLHSGEGNEAFHKCRPLVRDPMKGPVGLTLNTRNCFDGVEEVIMLGGVLDVGIDEERVSFRVDVLHHDLETIEALCLGDLNHIGEAFVEVLVDDTVGSCEEGKNMWNEVTFIVVEMIVPVMDIFG